MFYFNSVSLIDMNFVNDFNSLGKLIHCNVALFYIKTHSSHVHIQEYSRFVSC